MPVRSNQDIIRIVNKWQKAGFVHELTCATDECRAALEPHELWGKVHLICPRCGLEQTRIPDVVLESEAQIDETARVLASAEQDRRYRRRTDLLISMLAVAGGCAFLGSFIHPLYGAYVGLILGMLFAWFTRKKRS